MSKTLKVQVIEKARALIEDERLPSYLIEQIRCLSA
jgi:hypothetical protein